MGARLLASTLKELRLVARDPHGLAILFLMPVAFVIIMSVALQDFFRDGESAALSLAVLDGDGGAIAQQIVGDLSALPVFRVRVAAATPSFDAAAQRLRDEVRSGRQRLALLLPPQLTARHQQALQSGDAQRIMNPNPDERIAIEFLADPALRGDARALVRAALERTIGNVEMNSFYSGFTGNTLDPARPRGMFALVAGLPAGSGNAAGVAGAAGGAGGAGGAAPGNAPAAPSAPSATQQNVPAYALLAMFMLVVPLSGAFIRERAQGSLMRLRSMPVSGATIIAGKVLPYFAINLLQLALCLALGRYLLPLLGPPPLAWGHSVAGVLLLGAAASLAAIGFALLVALYARTTEQATAFGAGAVLIMAALGGVMVPKMLMPSALQQLAAFSPLGWALDGFLDLFVRGAGAAQVFARAGALLAFAAICFAVAIAKFSKPAPVH